MKQHAKEVIKIEGMDDIPLSFEEVTRMAFDPATGEQNAKQYQTLLIRLKDMVDNSGFQWSMFYFVLKPKTNEVWAWH